MQGSDCGLRVTYDKAVCVTHRFTYSEAFGVLPGQFHFSNFYEEFWNLTAGPFKISAKISALQDRKLPVQFHLTFLPVLILAQLTLDSRAGAAGVYKPSRKGKEEGLVSPAANKEQQLRVKTTTPHYDGLH